MDKIQIILTPLFKELVTLVTLDFTFELAATTPPYTRVKLKESTLIYI